MINDNEKAAIIAVFGKHYSPPIIKHLTEQEIFNEKAEPFKSPSIRQIVCGNQENAIVEKEILLLVKNTKRSKSRIANDWKKVTDGK